jgi:hypothetical protein
VPRLFSNTLRKNILLGFDDLSSALEVETDSQLWITRALAMTIAL